MPSRHVVKEYASESFYHLYNRGIEGRQIFTDEQDFTTFMNYIKRYLGEPTKDKYRRKYPYMGDALELNAYCLMQNNFHLLMYQEGPRAISDFMRSLLTSYTMYYNKRHQRSGSLFHGRYQASRIEGAEELLGVSRYIHRQPMDYRNYPYTSYAHYIGNRSDGWIRPGRVLAVLGRPEQYVALMADEEGYRRSLESLEGKLADH